MTMKTFADGILRIWSAGANETMIGWWKC